MISRLNDDDEDVKKRTQAKERYCIIGFTIVVSETKIFIHIVYNINNIIETISVTYWFHCSCF